MWSMSERGSWIKKASITNIMSDCTDEFTEVMETGNFQVGDSVTAYTYPSTEGLIISRTVLPEGRLDLTLIVAPHKKRGKKWSRATIISRDASRLSKKTPINFNFPIKGVEALRSEAKIAKGESAWAYATCVSLDKEFRKDENLSETSGSEEVKELKLKKRQAVVADFQEKRTENLEDRVEELVALKEELQGRRDSRTKDKYDTSDSDFAPEQKKRKEKKRSRKKRKSKKKKYTSSSNSSSSSSSSSSSDESDTGEVGEKGKTGIFSCPFHEADARGFKDIKYHIKGQSVTRKHVRKALHNLYSEYTTLSMFTDNLIAKANASQFKPFTSDTVWLQAYSRNIDSILLCSLGGPWTLWNEPYLDEMIIGFLELVVRVSPHKEFPICLEDSVRKWMRKKRMGTNTKYGPVSYAMQHGKFTDSGIVLFQGGSQRNKDRQFPKAGITTNPQKATGAAGGGGDKKPPPSPHA